MAEFLTESGRVTWNNTKHTRNKPKGTQKGSEHPAPRKRKKSAKNPKGTHTVFTLVLDGTTGKRRWVKS